MPVAVGVGVITPPPGPVVVQPGADVGRARATWVAPDGTEWPLDVPSLGWFTPDEVSGLGAAPISLVTDPHPRGGARVRHVQPQPRNLVWPLVFAADTHMGLVQVWRRVASAFTQTRRLGPGVLRVARPDGSLREIEAWYEAGFDGQPGAGHTWDAVVLSLYCEDPYWMGEPVTDFRAHVESTKNYLNPYMTVASTQVLGSTVIFNAGDVEAWPTWTITGPASEVTATNETTGETWTLTPQFGDGDSLGGNEAVITTDPPSVVSPDGESWTGLLNWPDATLWALQPGVNEVTFSVSGADTGTRIDWSYRPRYETA